ncbi:MAG: T9SS type A sorting domain-containing protein [Bacteroidia bacterium]|nr:T9SS type A sorting domain-containing protein [Bacteroidia bacterium]
MKKTYTTIKAFAALFGLLSLNLSAQISGTVTVDNSSATGGTNYQTFGALASALNTGGVNGPLVVNVMTGTNSGTYNEQVQFNQITGMSATNNVTINGNGCLLSFNCTSGAPYVMQLNGTDYLTVNNLKMQSTNTTYGLICMLVGSSNYNTFSACTFSCATNNVSSSSTGAFIITSSNTSASSGGTSSFNSVKTCTMFSGYYGIYAYGNLSAPWLSDNTFRDCRVTDFYMYAMYGYGSKNTKLLGCTFDRDTRTTFTTTYFIYGWYMQGAVVDRCTIRNFWAANPSATGTFYGLYYFGYYGNGYGGDNSVKTVFTNNIVRDMAFNGTTYFFYYNYGYYNNFYCVNNTFSYDFTQSTTGTTYILYYCYPSTSGSVVVKNNIFSITKPGAGSVYAYYSGTTGADLNYNDYYITSTNGYFGYYGSTTVSGATGFAAWQNATSQEAQGKNLDPQYANYLAGDLHPTNVLMNNLALPLSDVVKDNSNAIRNPTTPDIGALEFITNNCSSTPSSSNSIGTPTAPICAGEVLDLQLATLNSDLGITYQWLSSPTSTAGPWTVISGETDIMYTTPPINSNTYYGIAVTCTNVAGSTTISGQAVISGVVVDQVPYYEGFEGITKTNKLPNCSWVASNPGVTCLTYTASNTGNRFPRTGSKFASFAYLPAGANYFYTNGIQMYPGITYSAAVWYTTEYYGYNNWTDLSIMVGPNQSTTGLVQVATSNGPAVSNIYKLLSNTFTVPTAGIYYVAVRGTAVSGSAQWLTWDDLSITIPCQLNSPTVNVVANSQTICAGDELLLDASGADSYTWTAGANIGATTSSVSEYPLMPTSYGVIGTSSLSGCSSTMNINIMVNPSPSVLMYASTPTVCAGKPVNLTAFGAASYQWNPVPGSSALVVVNPTITTTYSVIGTDPNGCSGSAMQTITVSALPTVNAISSAPSQMCSDDFQTLTASGAATYVWIGSNSGNVMQGNPLTITNLPAGSVSYTVTGTDVAGCQNTAIVVQNVDACTGLSKHSALSGLNVYPNPTSAVLTVELNNSLVKTITVSDLTGRIIMSTTNNNGMTELNLNELANGVYYVKVSSENASEVVKVVKQ